jgi:hypothetical protein
MLRNGSLASQNTGAYAAAVFVSDPTGNAYDAALSAHASLERVLLADRLARAGLSDYTYEFYN